MLNLYGAVASVIASRWNPGMGTNVAQMHAMTTIRQYADLHIRMGRRGFEVVMGRWWEIVWWLVVAERGGLAPMIVANRRPALPVRPHRDSDQPEQPFRLEAKVS